MNDITVGAAYILVGVLVTIFREKFVKYSVDFQNRYMGFNFGDKTIRFATKLALVLGAIIIALGILVAIGQVVMKQVIGGVIVVLVGVGAIFFRDTIAKDITKLNNDEGLGFYKYGQRERKTMLRGLPIFGGFLVLLGILILTGIFKLQ